MRKDDPPCAWCGIGHEGGPENCDPIPMHYKIGEFVQIKRDDGSVVVTSVERIKGTSILLKSGVGNRYLLLTGTGEIQELGDEHRCRDCGEFKCECHNQKENTMPKTIKIADLADEEDGFQIGCIEGVLKSLYDPTEPNDPKFSRQQNAVLRDDAGDEHRVTFSADDHIQDMSVKGKRIRLSSSTNSRGSTGVKLKVEWDKKKKPPVEYRKIWVTGTAKVEILDGSESQSTEKPSGGSQRQAEQPQQSLNESTVRHRVFDYFRVLGVVKKGYDAMREEHGLPEIPESGMREIATFVSLTYKGQYGVYQPPFFGREEKREESDEPAFVTEDAPKPKLAGWEAFVHPKSGKTLRDIYEDDNALFMQLVAWAWKFTGDNMDAKKLQANLLLGADALGVDPKVALEASVIERLGGPPNLDALDKYADDTFGVTWDDMTKDDSIKALRDLTAIVKFLQKAGTGDDDIPG